MPRTNDQILMKRLVEDAFEEDGGGLSRSEFFELYSAEQVLKDYGLSWDELEDGIVDGSDDGGVDAVYLFLNGVLVSSIEEVPAKGKNPSIELWIIQSKETWGFAEKAVEALLASLPDLLSLDASTNKLAMYNDAVQEKFMLFRDVYLKCASRIPRLEISVAYATLAAKPNAKVQTRCVDLRASIVSLFSDAKIQIPMIGAPQLFDKAMTAAPASYQLPVAEAMSTTGSGFVGLVRLDHFFGFVEEASHNPGLLFEANVRDHQGANQVNKGIRSTLEDGDIGVDFWWLNNGVTIVTDGVTQAAKTLTMQNPQIVNGRQTTTEVLNYFASDVDVSDQPAQDGRHILVRVLVPQDDELRDKIIRATNSQTTIPLASLRATDPLQRQIEEFLRTNGLFYDRRKNYYKNIGKKRSDIVTIPFLAQSVMTLLLYRPDDARARPASLLKRDEDYEKVFSPDYQLGLYLACAQALRRVDSFLAESDVDRSNRNNYRFLTLLHAVGKHLGAAPLASTLADLDVSKIDLAHVQMSIDRVKEVFDDLESDMPIDQAAKSRRSAKAILEDFNAPTTS